MKQFWVDVRPWNKEIATTAIESGADAVVVDHADDIKKLGRITTIAPDGDMKIGADVAEVTITDKASENKAAGIKDKKFVIVTTSDWTDHREGKRPQRSRARRNRAGAGGCRYPACHKGPGSRESSRTADQGSNRAGQPDPVHRHEDHAGRHG
jgi:hypothetical protein